MLSSREVSCEVAGGPSVQKVNQPLQVVVVKYVNCGLACNRNNFTGDMSQSKPCKHVCHDVVSRYSESSNEGKVKFCKSAKKVLTL